MPRIRPRALLARIALAAIALALLPSLGILSGGTTGSLRHAALASAPLTPGYVLAGADGSTYPFGTAGFGDTYSYGLTGLTGSHPLSEPIVGMAATPDGKGYWLVAADGGVFNFGDAPFEGSMGGSAVAAPVVGLATGFYAALAVNPLAAQVVVQGAPYTLQASASGGSGGYTWSASGLPPGLSISASGLISGTPPSTDNGEYPATVTVTDSTGVRASETVVFDATWVSSLNWSGYAITGSGNGTFTGVSGTFTVPGLTANQPASCSTGQTAGSSSSTCTTSVWLGIDGFNNQSLIQAGIAETPIVGGSEYDLWPWWETLPNPASPFNTPVTVNPGDSVTVSIVPASAAGYWNISLRDNTNGESAAVPEAYSGPVESAEWIVEAPQINGSLTTLSPYSPAVQFSHIGYTLNAGDTASSPTSILLCQNGSLAAAPGGLAGGGFQVGYQAGATQCP